MQLEIRLTWKYYLSSKNYRCLNYYIHLVLELLSSYNYQMKNLYELSYSPRLRIIIILKLSNEEFI